MKPKHTSPYKTIPGNTYAMKAEGSDQYIWGQVIGRLDAGYVQFIVRAKSEANPLSWSLPHGAMLNIQESALQSIPEPADILPLKTWVAYQETTNAHVIPTAEWPSHQMAGDCVCNPILEYHGAGTVIKHNPLDPEYPGQDREHLKASAKVRLN